MATAVVATLAVVGVGGLTLYEVITRLLGGGDEGPNLVNSTVGEYDNRHKNAIFAIDVDMRKSGVMTEMMLVAVIGILATLCCLYTCCSRQARMCHGLCYHEKDEDRWRKNRMNKREKLRRKKILKYNQRRIKRQLRHEVIQECELIQHRREIMEHDQKQAKKLAKVHLHNKQTKEEKVQERTNLRKKALKEAERRMRKKGMMKGCPIEDNNSSYGKESLGSKEELEDYTREDSDCLGMEDDLSVISGTNFSEISEFTENPESEISYVHIA